MDSLQKQVVAAGKPVFDNIKAVKGEEYAQLVALWVKVRLTRIMFEKYLPVILVHYDEVVCSLFAALHMELERKVGKTIDMSKLDDDAVGFTGAMLTPMGMGVRREKKGD